MLIGGGHAHQFATGPARLRSGTGPIWHTNLNRHLTESMETVKKMPLECVYPGNEYADILCLTNLPRLKVACAKNISKI